MLIETQAEAVSATSDTEPTVSVASTVPLANAHDLANSEAQAAHTTEASHDGGHESGGMPQLDVAQWPGQMLWLVIIFTVFYLMVWKFFAPRLRHIIAVRGSTIAEDLANARANRDEAEAQAREAEADIAQAQAQARRLAAESLSKAQKELADAQSAEDARLAVKLAEAEDAIKASRDKALSHVTDIATDTARAMVEKLVGKAPSEAALKAALPN